MSVLKTLTAQIESTEEFKDSNAVAMKIIAMSKNVLASKGQVKGIELVSTSQATYPWENGEGDYRIANLNAIPHWKATEFTEALKNNDFMSALNCNFTFRLDTTADVTFGDIVSFKLTEYTNSNGEIGLNVRNIKTEQAVKKAISLSMFGAEEAVEVEETSEALGM